MNRGFRYALEPVRITRQWGLDDLLLRLDSHNVAIAAQQAECAATRRLGELAASEWQALTSQSGVLSVDRFTRLAGYMDMLALRLRGQEAALAELERQRELLVDQVISARRGLDALEEHREREHERHIKARLSGEFRMADDLWTMSHSGSNHDY